MVVMTGTVRQGCPGTPPAAASSTPESISSLYSYRTYSSSCLPGAATPLRWAQRIAYWNTSFFKLMTIVFGFGFACVLAGLHVRWSLMLGNVAAGGGGQTGKDTHGMGDNASLVLFPFAVRPRDVASGEVPALWWLYTSRDKDNWLWRHLVPRSMAAAGGSSSSSSSDGNNNGPESRLHVFVSFVTLHLSISTALITWLFAFVVFATKAGTFHFFVMPLLWRGTTDAAKDTAASPQRTAEVMTVNDGEEEAGQGQGQARRTVLTRLRSSLTNLWHARIRLWRWRFRAFAVSGFGSSFTIMFAAFTGIVALIIFFVFARVPVTTPNIAAPLHLRLLWTAVRVPKEAALGARNAVLLSYMNASSVGGGGGSSADAQRAAFLFHAETSKLFSSASTSTNMAWSGTVGGEGEERTVLMCDLGIQAGLPRAWLSFTALLSMLLGILCYAWVPFFLVHASSAIVYAPRRRSSHTRTPQQLQEASIVAFMRSKWAVAVRETPNEVEAFLAMRPLPQSATATSVSNGGSPAASSVSSPTMNPNSPLRQTRPGAVPPPPSPPLRAVPPEQLFGLNSAFMLFPERHRATTRTGVPIHIDKLPQYLRLSTRDLYYFNDRYFFNPEGAGSDARRPSTREAGEGANANTQQSTNNSSSSTNARAVKKNLSLRRLLAGMIRPSSSFFGQDGFVLRAWALVTEFTMLRLPFLLLCFILSALIVAGPTARCHGFWNLVTLLRSWGHYDGSPNRGGGGGGGGGDNSNNNLVASVKAMASGRLLAPGDDDDEARMCAEPILIALGMDVAGRVVLAAAVSGGLLLSPLVFGVPVIVLLSRRRLRRRELQRYQANLSVFLSRSASEAGHHGDGLDNSNNSRREAEREDVVAGGVAGAQCFFHQSQDMRRRAGVAMPRRSLAHTGAAAANPFAPEGHNRPWWCTGAVRSLVSAWRRVASVFARRTSNPPVTAAALGVPTPPDLFACRCREAGERVECGLCLARHRRWWAVQRRASRTAQSDPRMPPLSPAFFTFRLYGSFVRAQEQRRQRDEGRGRERRRKRNWGWHTRPSIETARRWRRGRPCAVARRSVGVAIRHFPLIVITPCGGRGKRTRKSE